MPEHPEIAARDGHPGTPCWEYIYAQSTSVAAGLGAHLFVLQLHVIAPARAATAALPGFALAHSPPPAAAPRGFNSRTATFGQRVGGQGGLKEEQRKWWHPQQWALHWCKGCRQLCHAHAPLTAPLPSAHRWVGAPDLTWRRSLNFKT